MIVLDRVGKRYGRQQVLDDVSLRLGEEGITALIGPNGAGKSTLLSIVGRLLAADAGSVEVDGDDVSTARSSELAKRIAVLRQDNHLAARLTVAELVGFGRFPHSKGRLTVADRAEIERALDYLDLQALRDRYLDELSGGQRQRAFIAMILAQDTRYVLLDEPLNNLDLKHMAEIMVLLRQMADDLGKRVVVVLHDINFASRYADRIVAMRDGRVLADGTPAEIMRPGVLGEVYDTDVEVREIDGRHVALYYGLAEPS